MFLPSGEDAPIPRTTHPGLPAMLAILRAASWIQERHARFFKPHGLTAQQFNVLRILRGAGAEGLPCLEISHRMLHRVPDITRLVDRLERQGLVARHRCETDRRKHLVRLTAAADQLLNDLDAPFLALHEEMLGALDLPEHQRLQELLERLILSGSPLVPEPDQEQQHPGAA